MGLSGQCVVSGTLVVEEAEACVVVPQREAVAHFASQNIRSTETEMGSSDNGNAHTSVDICANFGLGILSLLCCEHRIEFLKDDLGFFTDETICSR
jgi:hypothetical protein